MQGFKEYFIMMRNLFHNALSFSGRCPRILYYCFLSLGYFIVTTVKLFEVANVEILGLLIYFYIVLASVQKRCRDFNYKGTLPILIVSIYFIYWIIVVSIGENYKTYFGNISFYVRLVFFVIITFIGLIPSSKEKDLTLTSPLLKHPNIYFVVCFALFFIGRYVLQNWYL